MNSRDKEIKEMINTADNHIFNVEFMKILFVLGFFENQFPKGKPRFLERHSNFTFQNGIVCLLTTLASFFNGRKVDFEFIEKNAYFKCSHVHSNYYQLNFCVYLYHLVDKNEILVEFQRRSGDIIQFMEFYREFKQICKIQEARKGFELSNSYYLR